MSLGDFGNHISNLYKIKEFMVFFSSSSNLQSQFSLCGTKNEDRKLYNSSHFDSKPFEFSFYDSYEFI